MRAEARIDSLFLRDFFFGLMFLDETLDMGFLFIALSITDILSIYFLIHFYLVRNFCYFSPLVYQLWTNCPIQVILIIIINLD